MLNKSTVDVLQQLAPISVTKSGGNPVVIQYPNTIVASEAGDILINYDIRATEVGEFETMPIYNISEFISVFKLFSDERKVQRIDNIINITDSVSSVNYKLGTEKQCGFVDRSNIFATVEAVPSVCEFSISKDNLKNLRNASGIFKDLDEYLFETTDTGVKISLASTNKFNAQSNTYSIGVLGQSSKQFSLKLPVENLNKIPVSDYTLKVKYNASKDSYRIILESTEIENFKVLLSLKK